MLRFILPLLISACCFSVNVLVLIISSDGEPVYEQEKELWREYMQAHPKVDAYFIQGNPSITPDAQIEGDIIWTKSRESLRPGILQKTFLAMKHMLKVKEYDYVVRTNLSSFLVFNRLISYLNAQKRSRFYAGSLVQGNHGPFASGSCMIFSKDVAKLLTTQFMAYCYQDMHELDDEYIGRILASVHLRPQHVPYVHFRTVKELTMSSLKNNNFQYRLKTGRGKQGSREEITMLNMLLEHFYGKGRVPHKPDSVPTP